MSSSSCTSFGTDIFAETPTWGAEFLACLGTHSHRYWNPYQLLALGTYNSPILLSSGKQLSLFCLPKVGPLYLPTFQVHSLDRSSWTIWVSPKSSEKCLYKRQKRRHREEEKAMGPQRQRLKQCVHKPRNGRGKEGFSLRAFGVLFGGARPC